VSEKKALRGSPEPRLSPRSKSVATFAAIARQQRIVSKQIALMLRACAAHVNVLQQAQVVRHVVSKLFAMLDAASSSVLGAGGPQPPSATPSKSSKLQLSNNSGAGGGAGAAGRAADGSCWMGLSMMCRHMASCLLPCLSGSSSKQTAATAASTSSPTNGALILQHVRASDDDLIELQRTHASEQHTTMFPSLTATTAASPTTTAAAASVADIEAALNEDCDEDIIEI
jgi:hypothetical protein